MVNSVKAMACKHAKNLVNNVAKCPGHESHSCALIDNNKDSSSNCMNEIFLIILNSDMSSCLKVSHCDMNHSENDQMLVSKCIQTKKPYTEKFDIRHSPNEYLWKKLERLIDQMISDEDAIPVRNVKSLMSTIPSTFTGNDIVNWLMKHTGASDFTEAVHLASRIASMGYIFCIDDHFFNVKNDSHTYYRFQTPFLYPSRCMEADTVDYAVYLCKRTMQNKQRLELAGYEAERLASLQNIYFHKWEFIYIQAESEAKVDKKRDKLERLVLESQERAYWDLHRPPPGCINTTDIDMRKLCRAKRPKKLLTRPVNFPIPSGPDGSLVWNVLDNLSHRDKINKLHNSSRTRIKMSKAIESLQNFTDQYSEIDLLLATSTMTNALGGSIPAVGAVQNANTNLTSPISSAGQTAGTTHTTASNLNNNSTALVSRGSVYNRTISAPGFNIHSSSMTSANPNTNVLLRTNSSGGGAINSSLIVNTNSQNLNFNNANTINSTNNGLAGNQTLNGAHNPVSGSPNSAFDQTNESPNVLNPWISDNLEYWNTYSRPKSLPVRRIKRWSFSVHELMKDPVGLEEFQRWLEKEFSAENLRFWQACQELKGAPLKDLNQCIEKIYQQYLSPNAIEPLNVDSHIADSIQRQFENRTNKLPVESETISDGLDDPQQQHHHHHHHHHYHHYHHHGNSPRATLNRYCFEEAEEHIFHLMKSDSYCRFLRSDVYRELFRGDKKKSKKQRSTGSGGNVNQIQPPVQMNNGTE